MDPLVLIGVRRALATYLPGSILRDLRDEPPHRYRLNFDTAANSHSVVVSLRAELPWIGTCASSRGRGPRLKTPFAAACCRDLAGRVVNRVNLPGPDRVLAIHFTGGGSLVVELAPHGANLLLLEPSGIVTARARSPRAAAARTAEGAAYASRPVPGAVLPATNTEAALINAALCRATDTGLSLHDALRRFVFGVGPVGARLVAEESERENLAPGELLVARIEHLRDGRIGPVVSSPVADPVSAAHLGGLEPHQLGLFPWKPAAGVQGAILLAGDDAASTAGIYHDALETVVAVRERRESLLTILQREIRRLRAAQDRAERDAESFADADRFRRYGEALLAGLSSARRVGDQVLVPDPYDPDGREMAVPAPPELSLSAVADAHFRRNRRARRGVEASRARAASVRARRMKIEALVANDPGTATSEGVEALMAAMRAEGIAVGLEPRTRASLARARSTVPRLEGVRIFTSSDGISVLVGRTGKDNDRLTFHLAAPEDFWLHVAGHPGAHVVLRNPTGLARPPEASLREAAAAAAWFSDARNSPAADVQWTRKKHVRRARGRGLGTVLIKRSETVRVRPLLPREFVEDP